MEAFHAWGRQLLIPPRLCLPTLQVEESRTSGLTVKATAASRHFAVQPRVGSAALPTAIPCSCSLAWLLSFSRNNPNLNSFPQDTNAFPPFDSCRHQYFPPLLDVCPHARKLKLPIAGSDYAPSVQIAEERG